MTMVKTFLHRALATADERGRVAVESPEGTRMRVALPPDFRDGLHEAWSDAGLLVAAAASSFALTFAALARRSGTSTGEVRVQGDALVEKRASGRYEFVAIELEVDVGAEIADATFRRLAAEARERAVVTSALGVPLHVRLVEVPAAAGGVRGPGPRR